MTISFPTTTSNPASFNSLIAESTVSGCSDCFSCFATSFFASFGVSFEASTLSFFSTPVSFKTSVLSVAGVVAGALSASGRFFSSGGISGRFFSSEGVAVLVADVSV